MFRVWPKPGVCTYHCARCGARGYATDSDRRRSLSREEREVVELAQTEARKRDRLHRLQRHRLALRLWGEGVSIRGTLAEVYLVEHRGLDVRGLNLDHALRWNRHDGMLVALMTDAVTNDASAFIGPSSTPKGKRPDGRCWGRRAASASQPTTR